METRRFESAFSAGSLVTAIGNLRLPTGRIIACDPFFCATAVPFARQVSPGDYAVRLAHIDSTSWGRRNAVARIDFACERKVIGYERALVQGSSSNRYSIDSGLGAFMDARAGIGFASILASHYRVQPGGNYYTDVLEAEFNRSATDSQALGAWVVHELPDIRANVVMFASGLGDGTYGSYWGLAGDDTVVCLVTDFGLI